MAPKWRRVSAYLFWVKAGKRINGFIYFIWVGLKRFKF